MCCSYYTKLIDETKQTTKSNHFILFICFTFPQKSLEDVENHEYFHRDFTFATHCVSIALQSYHKVYPLAETVFNIVFEKQLKNINHIISLKFCIPKV